METALQVGDARTKLNEMVWTQQGVNGTINDGFLLYYQVKMRKSKIGVIDPLKMAKFFAKGTFRDTAQEPRNQMR